MAVDVHAHLYPRAFMEAVASDGPKHGVSLRGDVPPTLCFEGIDFWRYTPAFWDEDAGLREMDAAGVERQAVSLGPPMAYWATPDLGRQLCRIFNDEIAAVVRRHPDRDVEIVTVPGGGSLQALIARDAQVCLTPGTYQMLDHGLHAQDRAAEEPRPLRQARDERVLTKIRMRRG
jgi:aminocarboxymuconate-semialdehyde decarboxylase